MQRANRLAAEFKQRAERSRDNILREASDRLRLREEREVLLAKALAERAYRRQVQANELKLRAQMDQVRWNLAKEVQDRMLGRAREFTRDAERYLPLLGRLLASAAREFPEGLELVAELNAEDRARLSPRWVEFVQENVPGRTIALGAEPVPSSGGVVLRTPDNRIRVDNTFEGRMQRLDIRIYQTIVERLFPGQADVQSLTIG
ncbi:MAG: V-type ATP synthase subunit E family protein [Gammaproteobacteria bacterium]|nr:V-type ATP synthase subunit E family protein [Gammaproteobacteria bacterium]